MKKYWKMLSMMLVIFLGIGTFYIHYALAVHSYPNFKIETVEGDPEMVENLAITAYYGVLPYASLLQITNQGSFYRAQESFFDSMKSMPYSYDRKIRDEYKHVLRGIHHGWNTYYEDDQYLVIVSLNTSGYYTQPIREMEIRYLNKESKKTVKTISHRLNRTDFATIHDVQVIGNNIIVFTIGWDYDYEQEKTTVFADTYTFNMAEAKFVEHVTILSDQREHIELNPLYESVHWRPMPYIVYRLKEENRGVERVQANVDPEAPVNETEKDVQEAKEPINDLYAYHVETGTIKRIELPTELKSLEVNLFDGTHLYFVSSSNDHTEVKVFNISEERVIHELTIDNGPHEDINHMFVDNGLLYVFEQENPPSTNASLRIFNMETGEVVYRGEIVREDGKSEEDDVLNVYEINFRE
jgi:hypothetical protein